MAKRRRPPAFDKPPQPGAIEQPATIPAENPAAGLFEKSTTPAAVEHQRPKVPAFDYVQIIRDGDLATLHWRRAGGVEGRWSIEAESGGHELNVGALTDDQLRTLACDRLAVPDVYASAILVTTTL